MRTDAQFEDLFQEQLEDLYNAEKQIVGALPKMVAAASSEELSGAFQAHLDETREQVIRLEIIFERMGEQPAATESEAMSCLLTTGEKAITNLKKSPVLDMALIAAAQKIEHYEIAGYSNACAIAEMLGQQDAFELLETTLEEESQADQSLSEIAEAILSGDAAVAAAMQRRAT